MQSILDTNPRLGSSRTVVGTPTTREEARRIRIAAALEGVTVAKFVRLALAERMSQLRADEAMLGVGRGAGSH